MKSSFWSENQENCKDSRKVTPTPAFVFREFSAEHSIRSAFTPKRRVTELFEHKRWKFGSNFFEKILAKKPTIKVGGQHAPQQRTRRLPFYFIHLRLVSLIYWHQENLRKMKKSGTWRGKKEQHNGQGFDCRSLPLSFISTKLTKMIIMHSKEKTISSFLSFHIVSSSVSVFYSPPPEKKKSFQFCVKLTAIFPLRKMPLGRHGNVQNGRWWSHHLCVARWARDGHRWTQTLVRERMSHLNIRRPLTRRRN